MGERLKKHLFWFSLVLGVAALLAFVGLIYLVQLTGFGSAYFSTIVSCCYSLYLCVLAIRYRSRINQTLSLSPLPFQIYFWLMVLGRVLSLVTGNFSGEAISVGMTIWAYHIIKQIKAYNADLPQI